MKIAKLTSWSDEYFKKKGFKRYACEGWYCSMEAPRGVTFTIPIDLVRREDDHAELYITDSQLKKLGYFRKD